MQESVLGLDIGSKKIKAVLYSGSGLEGGRVLAAETVDIGEDGGFENALKKLAENSIFQNVSCCVLLPFDQVMFRQVYFPFRDDSKIRKALDFELEPLVFLPRDEIIADYFKTPSGHLLVAVAARKYIRDLINAVEENLTEVFAVDISPTALSLSSALWESKPEKSGMVVDIGDDCTIAAFYEDGALIQIRSFAFGGDLLTSALAEEMKIDGKKARQILIDPNREADTGSCADICRNFCQELKNTVEVMKISQALKKDPADILITGVGSLFASVRRELENYFSAPVSILDLANLRKIKIEENLKEKYQSQIMNTALAAALRVFSGRKSINFRQGEFAAKRKRFSAKEQLRWAAMIAAAIICLFIANQLLDFGLQARRLHVIKKQISFIFKKNYPDAPVMVDPLQQLKTKLAENRKVFGLQEGAREIAVADLLKEISRLVPSSVDMVISDFSYEGSVALIKGQTDSIDSVSRARNELMKSEYFKDVVMGQTSLKKDDAKVDFSLRIELK
ncbi:MAG TPA: hypothetical protein ENN23_02570 [Deltaproteobacteria bacterium]|nr:hypothetical protein [Deltaproteobacteria bacterium]